MAMFPFTVWEQECFYEKEKMVLKKDADKYSHSDELYWNTTTENNLELRASVNIECKINGVLKIVNVPLLFKG